MNKKNVITIKSLFALVAFFVAGQTNQLFSNIIGSIAAVTRQNGVTSFNAAGAPNVILGFTSIQGGLILAGSATTCTWNALFPIVGGRFKLFGGQLFLQRDLVLSGTSLTITSSGSILAVGNSITLGPFLSDLSLTPTLVLDTATLVLSQNVRISSSLRLRNRCKIDGQGKRITLQGNGEIDVLPGGNLTIENAEIWGVKKNNVRCFSDRGAITFRNCYLYLAQDYTFSSGSFFVDDHFVITGTNKFIYTTGLTSTIGSSSMFFFDLGTTLSYNPRVANPNLIFMTDMTSNLYLNGCTLYSTRTGLQLSSGTLIIDDTVTFTSEARYSSEAMIISSNLTTKVLGRATIDLYGFIRYD